MWQSVGLTLLVIVATLLCVLLFMLCGKPGQLVRAASVSEAVLGRAEASNLLLEKCLWGNGSKEGLERFPRMCFGK